ncbi:hypothetical protein [Nonomuraea diastatica]|uniref:Protease n=1 Tax=Nonomuraea diastatica TaxID=1848329 RepID=A0A4R4W3A3_9ACTN|nr:hypothetical protein [Nonomuraea diastatica]TDD13018.1 hypothetical protein E1294_42525 [Nonomuraea diastatica]
MSALVAGSALTCLVMAGTASAAQAASGRLALSSGSVNRTFLYDTCQPATQYPWSLSQIDKFDNQPSPGCQAVLINQTGASKVLCEGRGTVPPEFLQVRLIRIQPGTAPSCGFETALPA